MATINIKDFILKKLVNPSQEIRVRSLLMIRDKLIRASNSGLEFDFNFALLVRNLFEWFKVKPLSNEKNALDVMILLFKKEEIVCHLIKTIPLIQLRQELNQILELVKAIEHKKMVLEINQILDRYNEESNITNLKTGDENLNFMPSVKSSSEVCDNDYEMCWSQPSHSDYNALTLIANRLQTESSIDEIRECLNHIKGKIDDFPAEYFMIPPYLINAVLCVLSKDPNLIDEVIDFCLLFVDSLQNRIKAFSLSICQPSFKKDLINQIKVSVVLKKVLITVLNKLDDKIIDENICIVNVITLILKLIDNFSSTNQIDFNWLFLKLMIILRSYRERIFCSENATNIRLNYFLVLNAIYSILPFIKRCNYCEINELRTALFDHSLNQQFPEIIERLSSEVCLDQELKDLLNVKDNFKLICEIFQTKDIIPDDELIFIGNDALKTVSIVESLSLTQLFFKAIRRTISFLPRNPDLKKAALQIINRLLSCASLKIRIHFYSQVNSSVKESFALLMEKNSIQMGFMEHGILGIPLDMTILHEIINHGITSNNVEIKENAETIVTLILKSHNLISNKWESIENIIIPMIPLLQCLLPNNFVEQTIQDLFNPDIAFSYCPKIKFVDVLRGNICYLFSRNFSLRSEAIYRLTYMISSVDMKKEYKPNIIEISDTIPNDICIIKNQKDFCSIFQGSSRYTKSNLASCLEILQSSDMEPTLKKTALIQLNIMCEDEELSAMVNDVKAWNLLLDILKKTIKSSYLEYQESVVPTIGVISKLLLTSQEFRQTLSLNTSIYILLLRSLFLFHTNITLQYDASLALFLLSFNQFIYTGKPLILPKVFKNIHCPIKFEVNSEGQHLSTYEVAYSKLIKGTYTEINCDIALQFIRISFNESLNSNGQGDDDSRSRGLDVNKNLKFQDNDKNILKISSLDTIVNNSLCNINNVIEYEDIFYNVNIIKTCLTLLKISNKKPNTFVTLNHITHIFRTFLLTSPQSSSEYIILEQIIDLIILLIENSEIQILEFISNQFEKNKTNLVSSIKNVTLPISCYSKVSKLITIILKLVNLDSDFKITLFQEVLTVAENCFKNRKLDYEKMTLLVLAQLSLTFVPHEVRRNSLKTLFHLTVAVKTMTQMSSRIQKLSLISIGNLLSQCNQSTFKMKTNNIIYLSGLCGHKDFEIRNLSWCMLEHISKNRFGVNLLTDTLQHLPGSFHSCCLTTMMDDSEVTMIRVTAGDVLANIISEIFDLKMVEKLFYSHQFFRSLEDELVRSPINADIIRVHCTLLLSYLNKNPKENHDELMLKLSIPMRKHQRGGSFVEMAGEISKLFIIYDNRSSHKITNQLAGDFQFLKVMYEFFNPNLSESITKMCLVNIIMFSMLLVSQDSAYNYFCNMFIQENSGLKFLEKALKNEWNHDFLQQKAIHFSTYMLLKSQFDLVDDSCSFSKVIDAAHSDFFFEVLENQFMKIFHDKSFSLTQKPSSANRSICDALSVLLKTSKSAKKLAQKHNFLNKIFQPILDFFGKFGNVCSDYICRFGEQRLKPIISNFILLYGIIFNWYSNDVLCNNENILEFTKILLISWSWSGHDKEMRSVVISTMAFLSDKSVLICQYFTAVTCPGITFTILQLVSKYVTNESLKPSNGSVETIQKCLRILQNCCACSEGRSFLNKENVLSIFDRFKIFENKITITFELVLKSWLELWEVSSRYPDFVKYQNIQILESFCEMSNKELNRCSWQIIRNLSFKKEFRNILINRNHILKLANKIMDNGDSEERSIICIIIWKLIVNNSNAKSKLKDLQVLKSIKKNSKYINEDVDLKKIFSIILEIVK